MATYDSFEEFSEHVEFVWEEDPAAECSGLDAYTVNKACYTTISLRAFQRGECWVRIAYDTPILRRVNGEDSLPEPER